MKEIREALVASGAVDLFGREIRTVKATPIEVRDEDSAPVLYGDAAVFNTETVIAGLFREKIHPDAFNKTLADGADVRHLFNHDPNIVLGRTKSGTTNLEVRGGALKFETRVNQADTEAMNLVERVRRGDIDQSSFAMQVIADEWEDRGEDEMPIREIREVKLYDVSTVTYPAYEAASSLVRAAQWRSLEDALDPEDARLLLGNVEEFASRIHEVLRFETTTDRDTSAPAAEEAPEGGQAAEEAPDEKEENLRELLKVRMRFIAKDKGLLL